MKRSLDNILTTHHMMGYLLNNNMVTPFFTLRVIFGPIHSYVATFVAVTENFVVTWNIFSLTLMIVAKTLLIFKWSLMAGTDDLFMGRFLFLVNLGFCFCVHLSRYWLGSMYESHEFQILSGIMVSNQINNFALIFFQCIKGHTRKLIQC